MNVKIGVVSSERTQAGTGKSGAGNVSNLVNESQAAAEFRDRDGSRDVFHVVIVDSRQCLREALAAAFAQNLGVPVSMFDSLEVLLESGKPPENTSTVILQLTVGSNRPDLEIAVGKLREWAPTANIVLLVDKLTREVADTCKALGIRGLVSSEYSSGQILVCVSVVESGLSYFPVDVQTRAVRNTIADDGVDGVRLPDLDGMLTPRQQQVMRYIAIGKSNKYIAAELSLCESTVKVHVSEVMRRLGATSRTHASYIINQLENKHQVLG